MYTVKVEEVVRCGFSWLVCSKPTKLTLRIPLDSQRLYEWPLAGAFMVQFGS